MKPITSGRFRFIFKAPIWRLRSWIRPRRRQPAGPIGVRLDGRKRRRRHGPTQLAPTPWRFRKNRHFPPAIIPYGQALSKTIRSGHPRAITPSIVRFSSFNHSAADLELFFQGANLQDIGDECWGIDNVMIWLKSSADWELYYAADFETGAGSEWNYTSISTTPRRRPQLSRTVQ